MAPLRGPIVALPRPQPHLMEFVSLLGLLLPTSLSSNSVFFSPSDLPVIILGALGENVWSGVMRRPLTSRMSALSPHSALLCLRHFICSHSSARCYTREVTVATC